MGRTSKEDGVGSRGKPLSQDTRFKRLGREPVGKGGKAEVWKARDMAAKPYVPERLVAVKVLEPPVDADDRLRLCREGGEDRRLDHENVVRIFDLRGGPRSPFLVMEYIRGEDLKRLSARYGRFNPERVAELAVQLCAAMGCLHGAGLIHRDIKPGNLMLTGNLDDEGPIGLKLIDLGIAQAPGDPEHTAQGLVVGTAPYLAPEVGVGNRATEASDVYGAGAVLYELATGDRLPLLSREELLDRRRTKPVPPPHLVDPAMPGWLSAVIMRAIEVEPGERYESAEEMARALEQGAVAGSEDPTTLSAEVNEAPTGVIGQAAPMPIVFRVLDALPLWLRRRLPEDYKEQEPTHWYLFLLGLSSGLILFAILLLPIVVRVIVTLCEIPLWLLTVGVLLGVGTTWFLRDESRRQAAARALGAAGGGLWLALRAVGRSVAAAAAAAWRWVSNLSWPQSPPPAAEDGDDRRHEDGRVRRRGPGHRTFADHSGRRRSWRAMRGSTVDPFLRGARSQLTEVGTAARAWAPWLGRRAYLIVLIALTVCLALWLGPALRNRVALQPSDHRTVLTAVPAAAWILIAFLGLFRLRVSRATPRRLIAAGVILLAVLTVLGMVMPSFSSWLEPRFWPDDQVEQAQGINAETSTPVTAAAPSRTPREVARALAVRVREVESRWIQLLHGLRHDGWTISSDTRGAVREGAGELVSRLNGWRQLSRYEAAREGARHWLKSMERTASKLTNRDCHKFTIGERGAVAHC
jgi:hypothetical protein